jgi:hypothetical protein
MILEDTKLEIIVIRNDQQSGRVRTLGILPLNPTIAYRKEDGCEIH